ncbi:MAG TPA: AmmeMemoRadiSam system protein B [Terriglobales bacterium]|nr:AmmeMemoRadiSam system protein B [Terriglobales bacterium]
MGTSSVRHPAVAGQFYPRHATALLADIRSYLSPTTEPVPALGCLVPHAGYMYSGAVAGAVYARLDMPACCILLCPNHTGFGPPLSIMTQGAWETPLGTAPIDSELASALLAKFPFLTDDADAHRAEHAIEVQLPFLQMKRPQFRFVPIAIGTRRYEPLESLGTAIGEVLAARNEPVLVLASSDMNHYESDEVTRVKDHKAIEQILALNPRGLYDVVMNEDISMCGYGPAIAMLTAAQRLGATRAELIKYATSGDVSGDRKMVVGYAGIAVLK